MAVRDEQGMATAEYAVGTLGAACFGLVLYKLGMLDGDSPWFQTFKDIIERALGWRILVDFVPGVGLKP